MNDNTNHILNKLEHIYNINKPKTTTSDPRDIFYFIHKTFKNGFNGIDLETFYILCKKNKNSSANFIKNILNKNGYEISINTIIKGIELFNKDFENEK